MLGAMVVRLKNNQYLSLHEISIHWLGLILFLHLFMACLFEGRNNPDEHYQILEFASYQFHHYPFQYPWELMDKIRSTFQVWGVIGLFHLLPSFSPFKIALLTRLFAGTLSAFASYLFIKSFYKEIKSDVLRTWFVMWSIFAHISLYIGVRYSSENIAGQLFLIAFCYSCRPTKYPFLMGMLLGFAFLARFQVGLMIFGFWMWMLVVQKESFISLSKIIFGILVSVGLGLILDWMFYNTWVLTSWNYFYSNLILGKAAGFGVSHWTYLTFIAELPYGPYYFFGTLLFLILFPKHPITWAIFPFVLGHQLISHKEVRFLYPILSFMPFCFFKTLEYVETKFKLDFSTNHTAQWINRVSWWSNGFILAILVIKHHHLLSNYEYLWNRFEHQPYTIAVMTEKKGLLPKNAVTFNMPYRFYLNNKADVYQVHQLQEIHCHPLYPCMIWQSCHMPKLQEHMVFDACPSTAFDNFPGINHLKKHSKFFADKVRLYEIKPST